jgi:thioredoxin 1
MFRSLVHLADCHSSSRVVSSELMKLSSVRIVCLFFLAVLLGGCATPPRAPDTASQIYDPHADGKQQLAAGLAEARRTGKRVLLDLGANWCSDSQATYELFQANPAIRQQIRDHFVLVLVDVNDHGGARRNQDLVAGLGNPLSRGIPVLLILTGGGKVLNADPAERLNDEAYTDPARVLAYLRKWSR